MSLGSFISSLAESTVTGTITSIAADLILSALGFGNDQQEAAYFAQVNQELSQISDQLAQITAGISQIEQGITAIEMEITDSELQTALQLYTEKKNLITQNFATYANAVAGLSSPDTSIRTQAIQDLYYLFQIGNLNTVAQAMLDISSQLLGDGELKGIYSFQPAVVAQNVANWVTNPANLLFTSQETRDPNLNLMIVNFMNDNLPYYDGFAIVYRAFPEASADAITRLIIPTWKAALTVQLQGLILLGTGWQNNVQSAQLQQYVDNVQAQVQMLQGFWATLADPASVDALVMPLIAPNAPTITGTRLTSPWWLSTSTGSQHLPSYPDAIKGWWCWSYEANSIFGNYQANCVLQPPVSFTEENQIFPISYDTTNGYGTEPQRALGLQSLKPSNFIPAAPPADLTAFLALLPAASQAAGAD